LAVDSSNTASVDKCSDAGSKSPVVLGDAGRYQAGVQRMQQQTVAIGQRTSNDAIGPQNDPPLALIHEANQALDRHELLPARTQP
jgi:hypothetical protein